MDWQEGLEEMFDDDDDEAFVPPFHPQSPDSSFQSFLAEQQQQQQQQPSGSVGDTRSQRIPAKRRSTAPKVTTSSKPSSSFSTAIQENRRKDVLDAVRAAIDRLDHTITRPDEVRQRTPTQQRDCEILSDDTDTLIQWTRAHPPVSAYLTLTLVSLV
jgi:hypothetical protein